MRDDLLLNRRRHTKGIAAIVPTSNKRDLLRECLSGLTCQTHPPDTVLVVDNGSTDGTAEMVRSEFPVVEYHSLPEPCGSAGGFAEGIRAAHGNGYDWLWLMDNDAIPYPDALAKLVAAAKEVVGKVYNSLVVTPGGVRINWGYHLYSGDTHHDGCRMIESVAELESLGKPVVCGLAQFYTGSLIHRSVIDAVGLPKLGYFTRGDEVDYVLRIQLAGFKTYTVVGSRVMHPAEPRGSLRIFGRQLCYPIVAPWKQYYVLRNEIVNLRRYEFGGHRSTAHFVKLLIIFCAGSMILPDQKLTRVRNSIWAFLDGICGRVYVNRRVMA